jgi:hypothetical protein
MRLLLLEVLLDVALDQLYRLVSTAELSVPQHLLMVLD